MSVNANRLALLLTALLGAPGASLAATDLAAVPLPVHKAGDTWIEEKAVEKGTSGFSDQQFSLRVESVGADSMVVGIKLNGSPRDYEDHITGLDLSQRRLIDGKETITGQPYAFPLVLGKSWVVDYTNPNRYGRQTSAHFSTTWKAVGWEDVTTPAGAFRCVRVEGRGSVQVKLLPAVSALSGTTGTIGDITAVHHAGVIGAETKYFLQTTAFDYAPSIGVTVKSVEEQYDSENVRIGRETHTVISYKPAG